MARFHQFGSDQIRLENDLKNVNYLENYQKNQPQIL